MRSADRMLMIVMTLALLLGHSACSTAQQVPPNPDQLARDCHQLVPRRKSTLCLRLDAFASECRSDRAELSSTQHQLDECNRRCSHRPPAPPDDCATSLVTTRQQLAAQMAKMDELAATLAHTQALLAKERRMRRAAVSKLKAAQQRVSTTASTRARALKAVMTALGITKRLNSGALETQRPRLRKVLRAARDRLR